MGAGNTPRWLLRHVILCVPNLIFLISFFNPGFLASVRCESASSQTYDPLNRLTSITYADGSRIEYTYDANGNRLSHRTNGPQFTASLYPLSSEVAAGAGSVTLELTANGAWSAISDRTWATMAPASGTGSGDVTISIAPNDSYRARDARITVGNAVHVIRQAPRTGEANVSVSEELALNIAGEGRIRSVSGLPSGMSYNAAAGILTGRPNSPGSYSVVVTSDVPGRGRITDRIAIQVESLPSHAVGSFTALLWPPEPATSSLDGLGGLVSLTGSSSGAFTGSLRLGSRRFSFSGRMEGAVASERPGDALSTKVTIITNSRDRSKDIVLDLVFRPESDASAPGLTGEVAFDGRKLPIGPGWKHVWSTRDNPAWANRDRALNLAMTNQSSDGPQGTGFAIVKLAKSGMASWSGTLADGRTFTGSFHASPAGDLAFYVPVSYPAGGVVAGLVGTENTGELLKALPDADNGRWTKLGSTVASDKIYRSGFDVSLGIEGAEYRPPNAESSLFGTTPPLDLDWIMGGGGIESVGGLADFISLESLVLDALISAGNRITISEEGLTIPFRPSLTASSGVLTGSTGVVDTFEGKRISRTISYRGLYIPDLDSSQSSSVKGFFLLGGLGSNITLSGNLQIVHESQLGGSELVETLYFNDNQMPEGWTLLANPAKAGIANGRFEARQVDTYATLERQWDVPFGCSGIEIEYTGNIAAVYWGMGTQFQLVLEDSSIRHIALGKSGYGGNTIGIAAGTGSSPQLSETFPLDLGNYRVYGLFKNGKITFRATKIGAALPLFERVVSVPDLAIDQVRKIRLFAYTTTGDPGWIDDVTIRNR